MVGQHVVEAAGRTPAQDLRRQRRIGPDPGDVSGAAPDDLVIELSRRYIYLYEKITGRSFEFPEAGKPIGERMNANLEGLL